jgi:hypothetical protein
MLLEIKIQCDCGTKYKFDVEPLNGRMPTSVFCPGCSFDGTDAANAQLRQKLAGSLTKTAPIPKTPRSASAAIGTNALTVEPPPAQSTSAVKRIPPAEPQPSRSRFAWGTAGALLAAVVATLAWFFLIKVTGYEIGFAAWGVGLLIGMGARGLAREGSRRLGLVAALFAFAAIIIGQAMAVQSRHGNLANVFSDRSIGLLTLLWLVLAVGSAWKLGVSREPA